MLKSKHLRNSKLNTNKKSVGIHLLQLVVGVSLFISSGTPNTEAAFELNFKPLTSGANYYSWGDNDDNIDAQFSCNMSFQSNRVCNSGGGNEEGPGSDGTPMYARMFTSTAADETNGKRYWHMIIGDYYDQGSNPTSTDGFYLEYIIEASGSRFHDEGGPGRYASASTPWTSSNTAENVAKGDYGPIGYDNGTNGYYTTSGMGNPTRVIMRQIVQDGETVSTFLKDDFNSKPFISQTVVDNLVTHPNTTVNNEFTLDMRMLTYDSADNTGVITKNITNLGGGFEAANQGDYDTTDASFTPHMFNQEDRVISAGKYTWTSGTGQLGANGTYTYYYADDTVNAGGMIPMNRNYSVFCDPAQNPQAGSRCGGSGQFSWGD